MVEAASTFVQVTEVTENERCWSATSILAKPVDCSCLFSDEQTCKVSVTL